MTRFFPIYLLLAVSFGLAAVSCDSDSNDKYSYDNPLRNSVMVTAFNLQADDSVLTNLDSVYFTIDLINGKIFNADSLPKGTRVNKLIPVISFPSVSKAEIIMPSSTGADTTINYLTNSTDSIDFSRGPVKLHLVSANEEVECTYSISVNVHTMNPDSLAWGDAAWAPLPVSAATDTRAVEVNNKTYLFTQTASGVKRSTTDAMEQMRWDTESVSLPAGAQLQSITACGQSLYIIGSDNALYISSDLGTSWTATGATMSHIYGTYMDRIVGVQQAADGSYLHVTYPATTPTSVTADCPVSGTSQAITYTSSWSADPLMIVFGGKRADGTLTGHCWAYDGTEWAPSSITPAASVEGAIMVPYFAYSQKANWSLTKRSILLAMGGREADGTVNSRVYMSVDLGVHWSVAPTSMQLPADIKPLYGASALVINQEITSRGTGKWNHIALPALAPWYTVATPQGSSRAIKPITEWDCPYIYIFGGRNASDKFNDQIYRAVINRLMFKPIQ